MKACSARMDCTSCRAGEVRSQEEHKPKERRLPSGCFFLQAFTDLILRLKPPRCPSSSFQLTVVVVRAARLVLGNGQPARTNSRCGCGFPPGPAWKQQLELGGGGLGAGAGLGVLLKSDSSSRILLTVVTILASPLHINTA